MFLVEKNRGSLRPGWFLLLSVFTGQAWREHKRWRFLMTPPFGWDSFYILQAVIVPNMLWTACSTNKFTNFVDGKYWWIMANQIQTCRDDTSSLWQVSKWSLVVFCFLAYPLLYINVPWSKRWCFPIFVHSCPMVDFFFPKVKDDKHRKMYWKFVVPHNKPLSKFTLSLQDPQQRN